MLFILGIWVADTECRKAMTKCAPASDIIVQGFYYIIQLDVRVRTRCVWLCTRWHRVTGLLGLVSFYISSTLAYLGELSIAEIHNDIKFSAI